MAIGLILTATTASAQVLYGSIVGTLTDATGAVVPNATVTVTNTSTGLARGATTDQAGYYSIPNLQEGVYELAVAASGFKPYTQKDINVSVNRVTRVDAKIEVGALTEEVSVQASSVALQTTRADVNTTLDTKAMENLPLSGFSGRPERFSSQVNVRMALLSNMVKPVPRKLFVPDFVITVTAAPPVMPCSASKLLVAMLTSWTASTGGT
jgi:hypothetical protein